MYIVRFVRQDGKPDEEYYYRSLEDAEYHFHLFDADDSGLYKSIEIESLLKNAVNLVKIN